MTKIQLKDKLKQIFNLLEPEIPEDLLRLAVGNCRDQVAELIGSLVMDTRKQEFALLGADYKK